MEYIYIGKILGTHGLKGELKLKSDFIYINKVLYNDFCFFVGEKKLPVILKDSRLHNGVYLIIFKDFENINLVENLKNNSLYVLKEDLCLSSDEYVFEDYMNLNCYFNDILIGKVVDIIDYGNSNYVFYITGEKDILIPVNDNFIEKVVLNDKIIFKEVGGLIDANWYTFVVSGNV